METTLNERIKMLRNHLNISQNDFSSKVDVSSVTIYQIEVGQSNPSSKTLQKIVNNTGISKDWLLHGKGEMTFSESVSELDEEKSTSWSAKAFEAIKSKNDHLEQEIQFLREMLKNITSKLGTANFNTGFDLAALLEQEKCVETVRVAA